MNIPRLTPLVPLSLLLLVVACGDEGEPDLNTRIDTASTRPTQEQPQMTPAATDSGSGPTGSSPHVDSTDEAGPPLTDPQIMAWLGRLTEQEMTQASLAQARATSDEVKSFAKKLLEDHRAMGTRAKKLVAETGIVPVHAPHEKSAEKMAQTIEALKAAPEASFDSLFIAYQVGEHRQVLEKLKELRPLAQHAALRKALDDAEKKVKTHLTQAEKLQGKLGR